MDLLQDPDGTRIVKKLPLPLQRPIDSEAIFQNEVVDWQLIKAHLKKEGRIAKADFHTLIKKGVNIFSKYYLS